MRNYTTQMDAARQGIITPEMKAVAKKEYRTEEEIRELVAKGQVVGYLSEPTKYYSVEGPNLYFEVTKDGEPKDPAVYME